ncbi:GMC oxidoreductase [Aspergillus heterothallicus]
MLILSLALAALSLSSVTASRVSSHKYDFVIVGAGTSGLVVANRLSELEGVTVAVIEAGESVLNDFNVTDTYAGGAKQTIRAGKALGGTSTIHGMSYTRAVDVQIDNWGVVENKGWSWKSLIPYYKKERPLEGWMPTAMTNGSVFKTLNETMEQLGIHYNTDANGGQMVGFTVNPDTIDRERNVREDAARAYYWPYESRSNLKVISNTQANRIIWSNTTHGDCDDAVAIGVEVTGPYGSEIIYASNEVILSAGSLRSPALLEISGVGNPAILRKHNISIKVNLTSVGENLQDQTNNAMAWESNDLLSGLATFSALPSIAQLYGADAASLASLVNTSLPAYAKAVSRASNGAVTEANLLDAFKLQFDLTFKSHIPYAEIVFAPSGSSFAVEYWPLLPFSRGSVHIRSANASEPPTINPNYFMFGQDASAQADVAKHIRRALETAPLSGIVGDEVSPGLDTLPANATEASWNKWVVANYRPKYHPVGTASMLPREKGGVVDSELRVYGTRNVRVVDASVVPFQLCGHLTSTLYAVAEKASDLIKSGYVF